MGGRVAMQGVIILMCALVLMIDLTDDGRLGKANFSPPCSLVKSLNAPSQPNSSDKAVCQAERTPGDFRCGPCQSPGQPKDPVVQHTLKMIVSFRVSSAGGLSG
jgi:hypothetical protein